MKPTYKFDSFNVEDAIKFALKLVEPDFHEQISVVLRVAFSDIKNLPSFRLSEEEIIPLERYVQKWVDSYMRGYSNRPSQRIGKKSNTHPDAIVRYVFQYRFPDVEEDFARNIESAHSIMMTIENLVGDLLEEYLSISLQKAGWYCCWGSTIDAVDFCKIDGTLLQVKNSDNSENSSSSRVRAGTTIIKWARRKSTKPDEHYWEDLQKITGVSSICEEQFNEFVKQTIKSNPNCLNASANFFE